MEYFEDIRFHICTNRFLPLHEKIFYPDTNSVEFIRNGHFVLQQNESVYELSGPIFFWMKRSGRYRLFQKDPQSKKVQHFYCDCYGEKSERMIRCLDQLFPAGFFCPADPRHTEEIFQQQITLFKQDPFLNLGELSINLDRLMLLAIRTRNSTELFEKDDPYGIHILAQEIRKNPFTDFNFPLSAEKKGITYYHFRRLFRAEYKMPPSEYLRKEKMIRACELLRMTDLRIKQIADLCSFDSLMDFSRTFKKYAGISPSAYRAEKKSLLPNE